MGKFKTSFRRRIAEKLGHWNFTIKNDPHADIFINGKKIGHTFTQHKSNNGYYSPYEIDFELFDIDKPLFRI